MVDVARRERARGQLLGDQDEDVGRIVDVDGREPVRPVADVGGRAALGRKRDEGRDELAGPVAIDQDREADDGGPDPLPCRVSGERLDARAACDGVVVLGGDRVGLGGGRGPCVAQDACPVGADEHARVPGSDLLAEGAQHDTDGGALGVDGLEEVGAVVERCVDDGVCLAGVAEPRGGLSEVADDGREALGRNGAGGGVGADKG